MKSNIKLALIGKNIQHSKSGDFYKKELTRLDSYDLIDIKDEKQLPSLESLKNEYYGVNITTPFKKYYLNQVTTTVVAAKVGSINCIKLSEGFPAENTDYLACLEILNIKIKKYNPVQVIILGSGTMAHIMMSVCESLNIKFIMLTRKDFPAFEQVDLSLYQQSIIVNCCSRDYCFQGKLPHKYAHFWDLNYNYPPHSYLSEVKTITYQDGLELLYLQAKKALLFWGLN